jgi:transposase
MPSAHPIALRERVVRQYKNGEGTYAEIAERLDVGDASVSRYLRLDRERDGDLSPKKRKPRSDRKITPKMERLIISLVEDEPEWTTSEIALELEDAFDVKVNRRTVGKALRRLGYTHKKGLSDLRRPSAPTWSRSANGT